MLAKDGVDAPCSAAGHAAGHLLVDIEMPRMDGFDLTRNVRSASSTRDIPVIMITSRTAEKHRSLAFEIGVNEYLGNRPGRPNCSATSSGCLGAAVPRTRSEPEIYRTSAPAFAATLGAVRPAA